MDRQFVWVFILYLVMFFVHKEEFNNKIIITFHNNRCSRVITSSENIRDRSSCIQAADRVVKAVAVAW